MVNAPKLESVLLMGNEAGLVAEVSSLFRRPGRYVAVSDGPRMERLDHINEIARRTNMVAKAEPRLVLICGLAPSTVEAQTREWPTPLWKSISTRQEAEELLRGRHSLPRTEHECGPDSLAVALIKARFAGKKLRAASVCLDVDRFEHFPAGKHVLVACERGEPLSEVIASNLAFSLGASFATFPELHESIREDWLDALYQIGSKDQRKRFSEIQEAAKELLPPVALDGAHSEVIFVTREFPWGIAVPQRVTSHVFSYPDFGRNVLTGIVSALDRRRSSRSALLVEPGDVSAPEMRTIANVLHNNGGLVRRLDGNGAKVARASVTLQAMPFDVMVFATHAGEWNGVRQTYEYADSEGRMRRLVVDEAHGFGHDAHTDLVQVQSYWRFYSLDGVLWSDRDAKKNLYVGTAITSWVQLELKEKRKLIVASEKVDRVRGAMALKLSDGIWMPAMHDLPPHSAPFVFNNACGSFHALAAAFVFAGARAYIGTLFPVSDAEAGDVATEFFNRHLGRPAALGLWLSQNKVYEQQIRRPYVIVGLPFCGIYASGQDPIPSLLDEIEESIRDYTRLAKNSPAEDVRRNSKRLLDHLEIERRTLLLLR